MTIERRDFLLGSTVAAASLMAAAPLRAGAAAQTASPAAKAFLAAHAGAFNQARRLGFLLPDGLVVVHDVPFPLDHAAYADHLAFHGGNWDLLEFAPQDIETVAVSPENAIVSCFFLERGKPKDAGFRLRPGFATATCMLVDGEWRALSVHFSSLRSQILDASPS
jgi:hypothetical protein